jgi:alpha-1,2-mannosyltransferase
MNAMGSRIRSLAGKAIASTWLHRERIVAWASVLLVLQIGLFAFFAAGIYGLVIGPIPGVTTDFVSFYAAGKLAAAGIAPEVYNTAAHWAMERSFTDPSISYQFFFYPPVYLLLCTPLSALPYLPAYVVFQAVGLGFYLWVMRAILGLSGLRWLVVVLAFPSVFWTIGLGQNAFLTAALFGAATLLLESRPALAGMLFGALCYKMHFGLLIPVALVAGGNWRAFLGAAASVGLLVALSALLFGVETWRAYLDLMLTARSVYETGRIHFSGYITVFGAARLVGVPAGAAYALQGAVSVAVALCVAWLWRAGASLPVRVAALAAGTLLFVPLALFYDLMLLSVGMAWLVRQGLAEGFRPGEKLLLAVPYVVAGAARASSEWLGVPLGPLAAGAVLCLCLMRARREMSTPAMVPAWTATAETGGRARPTA